MSSEFLTWNLDIIHKATVRSQAAFCVRAKMLEKKDFWVSVNTFDVLIWALRNSAAVVL